jgi:hypothetical protein
MDWVKVLLTILRSASKIAIGAIIRARNDSVEMGRLVVGNRIQPALLLPPPICR